MRRTIALTITALMALALAPFGVAQASHEFGHTELVVDITKPSGAVSGTVDVEVRISENYGTRAIKEYWVRLEPSGGGDPFGYFCSEVYGDAVDESRTLKFTWDTNRYPTGSGVGTCDGGNPELPQPDASAPLPNGNFRIAAFARLTNPLGQNEVTKTDAVDVGVNNLPSTPTGVALDYKESKDRITVSWNPNPETHDSIEYRVQECKVSRSSKPCGTSDWKTVADDVADTSAGFTRTEPGIYRYRVVALRPAADGSTLTSPGAATPQSDPTEITVEEDPDPTTTTTEPDGDDDDGDGSSTSSEPETRTVVKPTRRVQRAAPQVLQRIVEEDPGYQNELPYENDDDEEAISGLPIDGNNEDGDGQLSTLVPLAGGLTLLIFALQLWYLNNRAGRSLEPIPVDAYGPDEGWDE